MVRPKVIINCSSR